MPNIARADLAIQTAVKAWTDGYAHRLHAVLQTCNPQQAYAVGIATVMVMSAIGRPPSTIMLERVAKCETIAGGIHLAVDYVNRRKARNARGLS